MKIAFGNRVIITTITKTIIYFLICLVLCVCFIYSDINQRISDGKKRLISYFSHCIY